ncbi:MAG TPA: tagaturonate epimerase family protein [Terriglobia bacterium]|nr:tagaturonate epimerase family protein [Terriglobia bacterium]
MSTAIALPKYSVGVGDRFAHQAKAQLDACIKAADLGVEVTPVWNKSNREHLIIGSGPANSRTAVDEAVKARGWSKPYFVDADHINLKTVDRYIDPCDFFTIDVADLIGQPCDAKIVQAFVKRHLEFQGDLDIPGVGHPFHVDQEFVTRAGNKYLAAVQEAGRIYRRVEEKKGQGRFITEVSMDETDLPQTPVEILIILAALADEGIPVQTIAPKFTGRFNKGVDYVGDLAKFTEEFSNDVATIAFAIRQYGLPTNLKLSVHSGSDKFSIYSPIHRTIKRFDAGVHLKTAGTTWLEELIGLAEGGGKGLELAKEIYAEAYAHREELCAPYAAVIDIDPSKLAEPESVRQWTSGQFVSALRHDPKSPAYNRSIRQLLHVGFKVAAKMGTRYLDLLSAMETTIAKNVTENLFDRHIKPVFIGA